MTNESPGFTIPSIPEEESLLTGYASITAQLLAQTEERVTSERANKRNPFGYTFSNHIKTSDRLAVLLDQDLLMIHQKRHPSPKPLLEVAHHAILLQLAIDSEELHRAIRRQVESEIMAVAIKRASGDLTAQEDKHVADELERRSKAMEGCRIGLDATPKKKTKGKRRKHTLAT